MNVEKAFDRVWHDSLIYEIQQLGTPPHLIKIVVSFLHRRHYRVRVEDSLSTIRPVRAGVSKGSCLSPLLYLVYTNDIPVSAKMNLSLFADDTMFHSTDINPRRAKIRLFLHQIDIATSWFSKWRLKINASKTVAILFTHCKKLPKPISLLGHEIPWATSAKYLGVTLDPPSHIFATHQPNNRQSL